MTERKIKQTHNYFLKHGTITVNGFTKDFGLSFRPHEMRIKSVSFALLPNVGVIEGDYKDGAGADQKIYAAMIGYPNQVFTLHWEGMGDICAFNVNTDRAADYTFTLKHSIDGQQQFAIRNVKGKPADYSIVRQSELIVHMEFIEYA